MGESHSVTGNRASIWSTRTIAIEALLCAAAMAVSFIEIPSPVAAFLKYDPSGIFPLLSGVWFGGWSALIVGVISWIPHLFINPVGALMSILVNLALALPVTWIVRADQKTKQEKQENDDQDERAQEVAHPSLWRLIVAMAVGVVVSIGIAIGANLIVTPLYTSASVRAVAGMILPILLPFNALKAVINCVVAGLILPVLSRLAARARN
jgi:riboflavin transporter FmnP